jgi:hypothetical protein
VPVYWTQKPNLKYKPPPTVTQANHLDAFMKHFQDLIARYNRIVSVNLVNQTGSELVLHEAFKRFSESSGLEQLRLVLGRIDFLK